MTNQEMINKAEKFCTIKNGDIDCMSCPECKLKMFCSREEIQSIISAYTNPLSNPMKG